MKAFSRFVFLLTALSCFAAHAAEPAIGQASPALAAQELNGGTFDLATMKGKVVIVHFWATWCPSCREEMAVLNQFYGQYHARGVEIIGISLDKPRKRSEVQEFMKAFGFPAAMINDADKNGFGAPDSIPVTYVIDRNGILQDRMTPAESILTMQALEKTIKPLLMP